MLPGIAEKLVFKEDTQLKRKEKSLYVSICGMPDLNEKQEMLRPI